MKKEIAAAVCCLKALLAPRARLDPEKTDLFLERLSVALMEKFSGHWFPENPSRGQAYRCIRINEVQQWDPEVLRACRESRIQMSQLELPVNLTLWVDPGEVCYRSHNFTSSSPRFPTKRVTGVIRNFLQPHCSSTSSNSGSQDLFFSCVSPLSPPPLNYVYCGYYCCNYNYHYNHYVY
uniref:B-cell translocation gene 3 n=1 Tax=Takifugu rubripes TaxID=31033 RepID=A0A3B5KNA3_TAKRU